VCGFFYAAALLFQRERHLRPVAAGPVDVGADLVPVEPVGRQRTAARQFQCLLGRDIRVEPQRRIVGVQHHRAAVVDVEHALGGVVGDQHEPGLGAVFDVSAEVPDGQHEQRLAVLAVDMPRLLVALFAGPLVPAFGSDHRAAPLHQRRPVAVGQLVHARIDRDRHLAVGPLRTVTPEHIVDAALAVLDVHHRAVRAGRNVVQGRRFTVVQRIGPAEYAGVIAGGLALVEAYGYLLTVRRHFSFNNQRLSLANSFPT
jgi:hypothetical protein